MSWSHDQVVKLLDLYQERPCLYTVKNIQYKNKHMRLRAYEEIQRELEVIRPGVTAADIENKINGLRTIFLAEHCKHLKSLKSGSGEDEVYEVSLWYYEKMKFILEHVTARSSIDSINKNDAKRSESQNEENVTYELDENAFIEYIDSNVFEDAEGEGQSPNTSRSMTPTDSSKHKTKKRKMNEEIILESANNTLQQIAKAIEKQNSTPLTNVNHRDDLQTFAEFVVAKLRLLQNLVLVNDVQQNIITMLFAAMKEDN